MDHSIKFWDKVAERYSQRPVPDEAIYQKKLQLTREYLRPDMELLEFGCGTGSTAIAHAPYVKHIRALDSSSKMIEIARSKARAANIENVTFQCSTISGLAVPDGSFDVVLALSVLHLLDNKEEVVAKVYRLLKPGGIFVTSTPCIADMMKSLTFFKFIAPIGRVLHLMPLVKTFSRGELETSLTAARFEIDQQWLPGERKAVFIVAKKVE